MAPAAASTPPSSTSAKRPAADDPRGSHQHQLQCPRCASTNTKFCYYNNYSTAQPRHFCRACRRYWTQGGTLRDVPVGGATRGRPGAATKRRRLSLSPEPPPAPTTAAAAQADVLFPPADLLPFPFLSEGSLLPRFDHGAAPPPPPVSWPSLLPVPDFFAAPWDDCTTLGAAGVTGAWVDMASLELITWPPPGN